MIDLSDFNIIIIKSFFDEKFGTYTNYSTDPLTSHNIRLHNESYYNNNYQQEEDKKLSRGLVGSHPSNSKESFSQQTNRTCWLIFCSGLLIVSLVLGQTQTPRDKTGRQNDVTSLNF